MKILYFPGLGGNEKSETFRKIKENYPNSEVIIYDNIDAEKAFNQIKDRFKNQNFENLLLIGQSLGGFWAEYFAVLYNTKLILINPSLEPRLSLRKYDIEYTKLEKFEKISTINHSKSKTSIIISKNDTVV